MKKRASLRSRRSQASHLSVRIQQRPWQDSQAEPDQAVKQSQGAVADFSHRDLFSHVPVRKPIAAIIQRFPEGGSTSAPADVVAQTQFNPKDILHKLILAIDQSDAYVAGWADAQDSGVPSVGVWGYRQPILKRKVDFATVVSVLSNLSVAESQAVQDAYFEHEKRSLKEDLFGKGESGVESNLNENQRAQIRALLAGTRAERNASDEEKEAATTHVASAQAAELQQLFQGELNKTHVDRILGMLRQGNANVAMANAALSAAYTRLTGKPLKGQLAWLALANPINGMRAYMLLEGNVSGADALNVNALKGRLATIDEEIAKLEKVSIEGVLLAAGGQGWQKQWQIQQLRKERKQIVEEIGQLGEQVAAEAEAKGENVQSQVGAVFGDAKALAEQVKGPSAAVIQATAADDPVAKVAAQLRKAKEADELSAKKLAMAMRGLRAEAEKRAMRMQPPGDAESLAREYFARLRTEYNTLVPKGDDTFDEIVNETGNEGDENLNKALREGAGRLPDVEELVLALSGDRKDTESVERVLRNKTAAEIKLLKTQYMFRTLGRSLDYDLFGQAPTRAGEEMPSLENGLLSSISFEELIKAQGKAQGTSRLNLEDYMQRPDKEGGVEEMFYIAARAEREYNYTIENRGATGWWRDTWGNEQRTLLNETIKEIRRLKSSYIDLVGCLPFTYQMLRPEMAKSGGAKEILRQMRLARHTIRGDRAAYEKATAELRETFQAIAAFAIQAALTALLTPAAGALFKGAMAARGVMAARMLSFVETVSVNAVTSVGGNLMVYGSDYSLGMLKADLLGGLGGHIGSSAVEKMLGPVAKGLAQRLGSKCSAEIVAFAKGIGNIEGGAWAQGTEGDLSLQNIVKTHMMGKGSDVITKGVGSISGLAPHAPVPVPGSGESVPSTTETVPAEQRETSNSVPTAPAGASRDSKTAAEMPSAPEGGAPTKAPAVSEDASAKVRSPESETAPALHTPKGESSHAGTMGSGPPAGSVIQAANPHDIPSAYKLYKQLIAADPHREVALIYNHKTDEWAIVQGDLSSVGTRQAMQEKGWDVQESSVARHNHPVGVDNQTPEHNQLPSGRGGDLSAIEGNAPGGGDSRWHAIDIMTSQGPDRTWVVRTQEGLWTVDYPDPAERGGRGRVSFTSAEQYQQWYQNRFGFSPDRASASATPTLSTPDHENLAGLNQKIISLIEGKDLPPLPEAGAALERSNQEVNLARQILANPNATPQNQRMAIEALAERAVAEYRAKRSTEKEIQGEGSKLSGEKLKGCCGVGRDLTADSIITLLGNSPHAVKLERFQVMDLGIAEQHGFTIVALPDGSRILIDPTFAQFGVDADGKATGGKLLGNATAKVLLEHGMVLLDARSAREYAMALGADANNVESATAALLSGKGAVLTEIVKNGQVERATQGPIKNIIELQRTIFGVHGDDVTSHSEIRDLLAKLPKDDPRRPLLDALASRLEQLANYQPALPEIADDAPIDVSDLGAPASTSDLGSPSGLATPANHPPQVLASLSDPNKRQALLQGNPTELQTLLQQHGNWRNLMESLTSHADPEMRQIAQNVFAYRQTVLVQLDQHFGAKIPGTASTEPVSDVDLIVSGADAGQKLIQAEAFMAEHYGQNWSEQFRMNFYTEVNRLTQYESVMSTLDDAGRAGIQTRMTELTEKFNFARMLHHAGDDPAAIARIETLITQSGTGINPQELRQLSQNLADPASRIAQRNALLAAIDQDVAALDRLPSDSPERAQLAQHISEKQIEANFYTEEAYIGPGAARMTVGGAKVVGHEAYQAMLSDLEMIEHIVHQANGNLIQAAREYELFKYVNRVTKAAKSGGQSNPALTYFEHLSEYIYKRHRGAHKETAHLNPPEHLQDMASDIPVTDTFLQGQFDWFMKEAYEILPKLRQNAIATPAAWASAR
ncbi:MAG: hypothetical protein KME16_01300 [Scytolyngbya sp. HA4215-MV1]|jgi:hypothetical protein|nr:hypothetical protein [Scytolyngbya sp. HA4215-MV1]